ncbi:MAG: hypothetical protein QME71_11045 [Dehalococcoidia bacterium]|nr:hypothetical protein [Dehalococcoidia bacterium]
MKGTLIFSSCTAAKNDSVAVGAKRTEPEDYISDPSLLRELRRTREVILSKPEAKLGTSETYAFDLYVQTGRAYGGIYQQFYAPLRQVLLEETKPIRWFFLSGGYGILAASESARCYQATFSYQIARQNRIPYTGRLWQPSLRRICEHIVQRHPDWAVYAFGSRDYTEFLKQSRLPPEAKIIESTGSAGPTRLSPVIAAFTEALLHENLPAFDKHYPNQFTKLLR